MINEPTELRLDQLLLDPNNYRFFDMDRYAQVDEARIHQASVQRNTRSLIKLDGSDELRALKESIHANGYVPLEALVVRAYEHQEDTYVVVEGNRRVAAMQWLVEDDDAGVEVRQEVLEAFDNLPAIALDQENTDYHMLRRTLMGLRHVSGIKQWGGYQRALLVVEFVDELGLSTSEAAKAIGMTAHEATRRYRALRALEQMRQDDEFGAQSKPEMYSLFHEAVAQPKVREWLGWEEDQCRFTHEENRRGFYTLLVPYKPENEVEAPRAAEPKLRTYKHVRDLRDILGDEDAEASLLDPEQTLDQALALHRASAPTEWHAPTRGASRVLEAMTVETLKNLDREAIEPLVKLYMAVKERLEDWMTLTDEVLEL